MVEIVIKFIAILIILLGTVDFAKAVMAGKEDNMKNQLISFIPYSIIIGDT